MLASRKAQGQEGFTVLEILIVVAIIVILAAIAIPRLTMARAAAGDAAAKSDLRSTMTALISYFTVNGTYPATPDDLVAFGFALSGGVSFSKFDVKAMSGGGQSVHMHVEHVGSPNGWHADYPKDGAVIEFRKGKIGE